MRKEIVINADKEQTRIAIVENGELVELRMENQEHERTIGNIFLGRVRRIMPSIQAAFVDIGQKQDAFLHFSDLADNLEDQLGFVRAEVPEVGAFLPRQGNPRTGKRHHPRRPPKRQAASEGDEGEDESGDGERKPESGRSASKRAQERSKRRSAQRGRGRSQQSGASHGRRKGDDLDHGDDAPPPPPSVPPQELLKRDAPILVKIVKEPIQSKGSRVSTDISLAGRFLVLVPLANYVAVSKKIVSYKERRRLRALARSLVPEGFGVIVRTVAEGKNAKALDTDLRLLVEKWRKVEARLKEKPKPPASLHEDVNMVSSVMRDLFSDDYDRILIDDPKTYRNIKGYIQAVAPDMAQVVQMHKGNDPVFQRAKIDRDVAEAFQSRVNMPSGGYLFIEQTEAMHVIDVNSGRAGRGLRQEENSLKVNLEAARILCKQVRLRDLGGIIVVDFIDLRDDRNRKKVYDQLRKEFRKDRAVTKVLPMSDFGLVQITRQRLRPSVTTTFDAPEPTEDKNKDDRKDDPKPVAAPPQEKASDPKGNHDAQAEPKITPEEMVAKIEKWIDRYKSQDEAKRSVVLEVHPFTAAFLSRKLPNQTTRWLMKYRLRIRLQPSEKMHPLRFRFMDAETGKNITRSFGRPRSRGGKGRRNNRGGNSQSKPATNRPANKPAS